MPWFTLLLQTRGFTTVGKKKLSNPFYSEKCYNTQPGNSKIGTDGNVESSQSDCSYSHAEAEQNYRMQSL